VHPAVTQRFGGGLLLLILMAAAFAQLPAMLILMAAASTQHPAAAQRHVLMTLRQGQASRDLALAGLSSSIVRT
jgi:hypothetical protein